MRDKHYGNHPTPPLMCDFSDTKSSLNMRLANIFDNNKKKTGIISLVIILIIIGLIGSFFAFGKKEVKQVNDSLTIYTLGYEDIKSGEYNETYELGSHKDNNKTRYRDSYDYKTVVDDYKRNYKDVDVNVIEFPDISFEAFADKVVTEILAGKGPDVIIFDETLMSFKDINKIIASGAVSPLDEFLAADETFNQEDYYQGILNNGIYRGKRYAFPMRFNIPLISSGENLLKNAGIDQEECKKDFASFMEQCGNYIDKNNNSAGQLFMFDNTTFTGKLLNFVGGNPTKNNNTIDTPEFRKFVENMKTLNKVKPKNELKRLDYIDIKDSQLIFIGTLENPVITMTNSAFSQLNEGDKPVLLPIRKPNGNIEALITATAMINANSQNKQNAYNFIKQLMTHNSNNYFKNCGISSRKDYTEFQLEHRYGYGPFVYLNKNSYFIDELGYFLDSVEDLETYKDEYLNEMKSMVNSVDSANFVTPIVEIIKAELQPFLDDKMTYEECIKQVQTKVDLYFAE